MTYLFLFFTLLFLLFLSSRVLTQAISRFFYTAIKSQNVTVYLLAFLFLPGVVIHELSHLLVANVLFVQTGEIEFFPKLHGNALKLGSVEVAKTDPIRRAVIGFEPVLVGISFLLLSLFAFTNGFGSTVSDGVRVAVLLFVVFEIGNTMFSSRKDVEGTLELLIVFVLFSIVGVLLGLRIPNEWLAFFSQESVIRILQQVDIFLCVPLAVNLAIIFTLKLLLKRR